jgi:hypothetical protein
MNLADLAADIGRRSVDDATEDYVDIITFIEASWGLGLKLYPVQRVILKAHYGMALDDNPNGYPLDQKVPRTHPLYDKSLIDKNGFYKYRIVITDFRRENSKYLSEAGYLKHIHEEGRCNIGEVVPGDQRREMVLSVGRRSGKTLITSCIVAYESYKLLLKGNPQKYYGSSQSNVIQLISVATDRDQAGLLYREASGHFTKCDFFRPYTANSTQSHATFQTPFDIDKHGSYKNNPKARYSLKVTFRSCVAKGLRGGANILVALDEVAHFGDSGQASADSVYQAVEPSTRTFSKKDPEDKTIPVGENEGRIILISSPLGRQGLFYKQYRLGFGNNKAADNLLCVQAPTWEVNPTVPAETFVASYLKDPNVFFTEFGAEFSDRTRGWITDQKDLMDCVEENLRPKLRAAPLQPHFMGIDIALVGDASAVAVGHLDDEGKVVLDFVDQIQAGVGEYEDLERLEFDDVADWIVSICKRFYVVDGIFDQWAGVPMEQALKKRGLSQLQSVHFTDRKNSEVYQNFKNLMLDRKMRLFNFPVPEGEELCEYLQELTELQAEYKSKYIVRVQAPQIEGKHDDLSDALVRMTWCATVSESKHKVVTGSRSRNRNRGRTMAGSSGAAFGRTSMSRSRMGGSHPSRIKPKKGRG